jgi:hypothetical protein
VQRELRIILRHDRTHSEAVASARRVLDASNNLARPDLDDRPVSQTRNDALSPARRDDTRQAAQRRLSQRFKQRRRSSTGLLHRRGRRFSECCEQILSFALIDDEPVKVLPLELGERLPREHRARVEERCQPAGGFR